MRWQFSLCQMKYIRCKSQPYGGRVVRDVPLTSLCRPSDANESECFIINSNQRCYRHRKPPTRKKDRHCSRLCAAKNRQATYMRILRTCNTTQRVYTETAGRGHYGGKRADVVSLLTTPSIPCHSVGQHPKILRRASDINNPVPVPHILPVSLPIHEACG